MKKCRNCSKPATMHITDIREGEVHELHFCESCAHDYMQSTDPDPSDSPGAFPFKFANEQSLSELDQSECPNCGITFREFRSQGRLGCPHDYVAFGAELLPLLENIHGETQHCGKVPKRAPAASQRQYQLIKLRNELRSAVDEEKYEDAARLRDEIQTLETELNEQAEDE